MALKFQTNLPRDITFKFATGKDVEGQYGPQVMYGVTCDGQDDYLYASPFLSEKIQAAGIGPGVTLRITKGEEGNKTVWQIEGGQPGAVAPANASPSNGSPATTAPSSQAPQKTQNVVGQLDAIERLFAECCRRAADHFPNGDICTYNATYTLFRYMVDHGHTDYVEDQGGTTYEMDPVGTGDTPPPADVQAAGRPVDLGDDSLPF